MLNIYIILFFHYCYKLLKYVVSSFSPFFLIYSFLVCMYAFNRSDIVKAVGVLFPRVDNFFGSQQFYLPILLCVRLSSWAFSYQLWHLHWCCSCSTHVWTIILMILYGYSYDIIRRHSLETKSFDLCQLHFFCHFLVIYPLPRALFWDSLSICRPDCT